MRIRTSDSVTLVSDGVKKVTGAPVLVGAGAGASGGASN